MSATYIETKTRNLVIIDPGVQDYPILLEAIFPDASSLIIDSKSDPIAQITKALAAGSPVNALHLISHGQPGSLQLGNGFFSGDHLSAYAETLKQWQRYFTPDGAILLYGCSVAYGEAGSNFVEQLRELTGINIAASTTVKGQGNWNLEYATGEIDSPLAIATDALAAYPHVLATFTVNSLEDSINADDGKYTLREAITAANSTIEPDIIEFNSGLTGKITLSSALPTISNSLTINGPGANLLSVSGNKQFQVFKINDGNFNSQIDVSLSGLTITEGYSSSGGGIYNNEFLTINNTTVSNNSAQENGGGLFNSGYGSANISNSTFSGNTAYSGGGGLSNFNFANISNSTFSGNIASFSGGGLSNDGFASISNSTITNNKAMAAGGGVASAGYMTNINNSIIAGNSNSDVDNTGNTGNSSINSGGYNLIGKGNATGNFNPTTDKIDVTDPKLNILKDNGGATQTHALLTGSPAIDAGGGNPTPKDQRGVAAVGTRDIGAYELESKIPPINGTADADILQGTPLDNVINGLDGNDTVYAGAGNDAVNGGNGNDLLNGNDGNDILNGNEGDDLLFGGRGSDTVNGDQGSDILNGNDGDDILNGGVGDDKLFGGTGNDTVNGGADNDILNGNDQNDVLNGDSGNDQLFGGNGDDILNGWGNSTNEVDRLSGNANNDTFILGNALGSFYTTNGIGDYAVITDFLVSGTDKIKLFGTASDYNLKTNAQQALPAGVSGMGLYKDTELIAVIQGSKVSASTSLAGVTGFEFINSSSTTTTTLT
jgi:CSLREA domain-containing protein